MEKCLEHKDQGCVGFYLHGYASNWGICYLFKEYCEGVSFVDKTTAITYLYLSRITMRPMVTLARARLTQTPWDFSLWRTVLTTIQLSL